MRKAIMRKIYKNRVHAFTLVELLVVMGIIAALISILLPVLNKARTAAIQIKCGSNLRQLMALTTMYASENLGYFPDLHNVNTPTPSSWKLLNPAYATITTPYTPPSRNGADTGDSTWDNQYLDGLNRVPNKLAIGAVDYLLGASGRITTKYIMSRTQRDFALIYCPANLNASAAGNWVQATSAQATVNGTSYVVIGNDIATGYCYYGNDTAMIDYEGGVSAFNFNVNTISGGVNQPLITTHAQGQLTFAQRVSDLPKYTVMWTDMIMSRGGIFASTWSNHITGKEASNHHFPVTSTDGGANIAYMDGHVEWRPSAYMVNQYGQLSYEWYSSSNFTYYIPQDN